jgi:energy-coupling factor transport system permease protein
MSSPLHSVTWLIWAVAVAASIQIAPNPLYVALAIAVVALVTETHRHESRIARALPVLLVVGVAFSLLRVLLLLLTTHVGGTAFVTVPEATLPRLLGGFTVGGPLEWPVLWQAAAEGFVVIGVMAAFGAFNALASHHELVQRLPRAFHEAGVVMTVALAFVPSTLVAVGQVREADRARTGGRPIRRGRLVRLVVPVLETGLERAVLLAESMDARGFGRSRAGRRHIIAGWLGLVGLLALCGAMVALVGRSSVVALGCLLGGAAALVGALALAGADERFTRYRVRPLTGLDAIVIAVVAAAPVGLALCSAAGESTLRWVVGLEPTLPEFGPVPALCLLLLATPALVPSVKATREAEVAATDPAAAGAVA